MRRKTASSSSRKVMATLAFISLLWAAVPAHAVLIGPSYPAPGGTTFASTGAVASGADGVAVWEYSGFDTGAFDTLYFGLNQADHGALGAGLDSSVHPITFSSVSGTTATWGVTTPYTSPGGPGNLAAGSYSIPLELRMTITGLGPAPWVDALTLGITDANVGVVADNSAGADFTLNWEIVAFLSPALGGWVPINSVAQGPPGGQTQSSFATGFYHTVAVPEPSAFLFGSLACLGFVGFRVRKKNRSLILSQTGISTSAILADHSKGANNKSSPRILGLLFLMTSS